MTPSKILIVDDRAGNITALASLIEAPDVEIVSALSGEEALELLLRHEVALALLDVEMPGMDGLELARFMRSAERTKSIPIVFVTAEAHGASARFEGYERGAIAFLSKPLDIHLVRNKVRVFVDLDQKSRALRQQLLANEALRREAEEANAAKSRFLANMSHEIRTPLGAVLGFAELLRSGDQTPEEVSECVEAIERNGRLLSKLIDDVIDLAKIEADRIELDDSEVCIAEVVRDIQAIHGLKAKEKGIAFTIRLEGMFPEVVRIDEVRLKQALSNVVGNAIKFTASGSVDILFRAQAQTTKLAKEPSDGDDFLLQFAITDTGCGMSETEASRIFQPFVQADSSTTRRYGGSGLGLVIARRLARLLGGDLVLTAAEPGKGSTFLLTVRAKSSHIDASIVDAATLLRGDASQPQPQAPDQLSGIAILVVDDARDNRELLRKSLGGAGAYVDLAVNGREALERARDQSYDVVLMDMQMPVMDGCEATRRLRETGFSGKIFALTAHATPLHLEAALAAGCDACITKPIRRSTLIDVIHRSRRASM